MLGSVEPEASASHLQVSVFAHSIAERFLAVPGSGAEESRAALEDAIEALRLLADGKPSDVKTAGGLRPFRDYRQIVTLLDVLNESSLTDASERLTEVVVVLECLRDEPDKITEDSRRNTVRFFLDLAREALYRSRQPSVGIPRAVRELCRP